MSLDYVTQVTSSTVFHVQVEILRGLDVLTLNILHNVWVLELLQNRQILATNRRTYLHYHSQILCRKEIRYCKMSQKEKEQLQAE